MKLKKASIGSLRMNDTSAKIQNNDILSKYNFDADNFPGMRGLTGSVGYQGSQGYQGSVGGIGDTGDTGGAGFKGSLGPRGYTGSQGSQGITGEPGYRGSVGATGYTGSKGAVGDRGYTGSRGPLGYAGSVGYQGSQGFTGSQGYTGSRGATGDKGFTGSKGYTGSRLGAVGATGDTGFKGSRGDTGGTTGTSGTQGYTGSKGATGDRGATGLRGSVGASGTNGTIGPVGYTGSAGPTGDPGFKGSRGATGFRGSFGYTGSRGLITQAGYKWEEIRSRAASSSLTFVASGSTEGTVSISTGTISAGDIIAAEINNTSSVSVDSTPKVMMFTIANDSTVTEMDHQHGWTTGNISETPDPDWYYYYLFSFAAAYASSTTIRFDNSYVTTIFASATSWGSTIFGLSSQQLYVGRIWKLTPNNATDSISAPTIGSFSTCFYDSFLNVSYINATITNNHDQTAIIQYDTTSFISSSAQEIAIPAGQSQSIQFVFSGNIQFSSRTIAARASVNGNFSTTTTRTESISFCAS